jgi:hypothetical protein
MSRSDKCRGRTNVLFIIGWTNIAFLALGRTNVNLSKGLTNVAVGQSDKSRSDKRRSD